MNISDKSVVSFHYTLKDDQGQQIETSQGGESSLYLHGADNIIPGLEKAMEGKTVGDSFEVTVEPAEAYGMRNEELTQRVPMKHLIKKGPGKKVKRGDVVQVNTEQGMRSVTVLKAGRHTADIDANHPLAGKTLTFEVEIADIRKATAEEVEHGHAHGIGGHQH